MSIYIKVLSNDLISLLLIKNRQYLITCLDIKSPDYILWIRNKSIHKNIHFWSLHYHPFSCCVIENYMRISLNFIYFSTNIDKLIKGTISIFLKYNFLCRTKVWSLTLMNSQRGEIYFSTEFFQFFSQAKNKTSY